MIMALVRKELRELLPLMALTAIVQLYLLACVTDVMPEQVNIAGHAGIVPFYHPVEGGAGMMIVVGGVFAILAGLWQTLSELGRGTIHFLLHRPLPRTSIFGVKLAVGATASLAATALPLLAYALWAATPGTHASPFFWSMTWPTWLVCLVMVLLYLGAFLSGLRPARWYASRFWPVPLALLAGLLLSSMPASELSSAALLVGAGAAYLWVILHIACARDYS